MTTTGPSDRPATVASTVDPAAIPRDVLAVCERLRAAGFEAHLVGGGIRDLLLGRMPNDFDVATNAHPPQVMKLFGSRYAIPTGLQHGTVTVVTETEGTPEAPAGHRHVEVTTFRGEGAYVDGRRPTSVTYVGSLAEDLSRRDFTMNAIGFDPLDRTLTDPFDGRGDLARRRVRAVGIRWPAFARTACALCGPFVRRRSSSSRSIRRRWRRSPRRSMSSGRCRPSACATRC